MRVRPAQLAAVAGVLAEPALGAHALDVTFGDFEIASPSVPLKRAGGRWRAGQTIAL